MAEPLSLLTTAYVTAARRGTGREPLTAEDRTELGDGATAFPLFG